MDNDKENQQKARARKAANREPFQFKIPGRYQLLLVTLFCIGLITITYSTDLLTTPLSRTADYLVAPFQNGISKIGRWFVTQDQLHENIKDLQAQNQELREENDALAIENNSLQQEKYELQELRKLYALDQQYPSYEKTGARVIAKDTGNWYHSFIIDKGTADDLDIDMNVLSGSGLVGRIVDIGEHWARVEAIIDDDSNVSATVLSTKDNMIVSGDLTLYESGLIAFSRLTDADQNVTAGDKVVTSNVSDKYLPGILIGYISEITNDANGLTRSGTLTPAVDFAHLDTVLVIRALKQTAP